MWKFLYNGTSLSVKNCVVENENNAFDYFSGTITAPSNAVKTAIGKGGHIFPDHHVQIKDYDGTTIFDGFLESVEEDDLDLNLEGRDFKVLLLDESLPRNTEYINQTGTYVLEDILSYSTKVSPTIVGTYSETISGTLHFDNVNLLKAVASVCDLNGYDFWVEYNGTTGVFELHVGERGTVTEDTYYTGGAITATKTKTVARDIINRQMVFGAGDGDLQIRCCVPYKDIDDPDSNICAGFDGYNADCVHEAATASQTTYGVMEGDPYINTGIISLDVAIATAKSILDAQSGDVEQTSVEFARYVEGLAIGDTIKVVDSKKGLDVTERIKYIKRKLDKRSISITFYGADENLESILAEVSRDSGLNDLQGAGATNLITIQSAENCGSGTDEELNLRFRFPDEVKFINKVYLSFNMKEFRAYSKGASAGTAHSHSLSIWNPNDSYPVYPMGLSNWGGTPVIIGAPGCPSASTSEAESAHTHEMTYGIYNASLSSPEVVVSAGVNGSESSVGTYSSDQTDLDITAYFSAVSGWQNIKIVPNQNMRVEAFLYAQVYIQST